MINRSSRAALGKSQASTPPTFPNDAAAPERPRLPVSGAGRKCSSRR
jgi:hypothetical protein